MPPALSTDKMRYYKLLALACEAVHRPSTRWCAAGTWPRRLNSQPFARAAKLPWLPGLVRIGLPDFVMPAELLPAPVPPTAPTQLLLV